MMISLDFCRKTRNFVARMNKRTLYIFSLWIATITVLLSTVMSHHHHMDRICMVQEQCQEDCNSVGDAAGAARKGAGLQTGI